MAADPVYDLVVGYRQYEVSAYARSGAECRHNLNYWRFGDYLGIGAGAHGKLTLELPGGILRTLKPKQPREFLERFGPAIAANAGDATPPDFAAQCEALLAAKPPIVLRLLSVGGVG